jgi:pimeloyl-ACP methyl ester carboxylesterase
MNADTRRHTEWLMMLPIIGLLLLPAAANAANQFSSDDMVVPLSISTIPPEFTARFNAAAEKSEPRFFIKNHGVRYDLDTIKTTDNQYYIRVDGKIPAGTYPILADFYGRKPITVGYNFNVHAPSVTEVSSAGLYEGAELTLSGYYFSKTPKVFVAYQQGPDMKIVTRRCNILKDSLTYSDPYSSESSNSPMDVDSGRSQITIQLPRVKPAPGSGFWLLVRNDNGYAVKVLSVNPVGDGLTADSRGEYKGFRPRGEIPSRGVKDYLLDAMTEGMTWGKHITRFAIRQLVNESKMGKMDDYYSYDLRLFTIEYVTVDARNNPVPASGVVVIPKKRSSGQATPLLSYQHGTMVHKEEAPSVSRGAELGLAVTFAAAEGYITSIPDHLGLGSAVLTRPNVIHPYCQWKPNAQADGDMLTAIATMLKDPLFLEKVKDIPEWNKNVLLTGYSEGGYLTLGLHRELEENAAQYQAVSSVRASAPMDGPYSVLKQMVGTLIKDEPYDQPFFAPYMLITLNNTYDIYKEPRDYLANPYDKTLPAMFDGLHTSKQINNIMPDRIFKILTAGVLEELRPPQDRQRPLNSRLAENDLAAPKVNYNIKAPIAFIHGIEDELVPQGNSKDVVDYLHSQNNKTIDTKYMERTSYMWFLHEIAGNSYHELFAPHAVGEAWDWLRDQR